MRPGSGLGGGAQLESQGGLDLGELGADERGVWVALGVVTSEDGVGGFRLVAGEEVTGGLGEKAVWGEVKGCVSFG